MPTHTFVIVAEGRVMPPKRMNFRKKFLTALTPPSFSENHSANRFQFRAQKNLFKGGQSAI